MDDEALHGYLQHHWAGAGAGTSLFRRVAGSHRDPETAATLARLADEVSEDRESLASIMKAVGARPSRIGTVAARVGAELGRLKPNGRILTRPPLTDVIELEALFLAVTGKLAGFELLRSVADTDHRLDVGLLDRLIARTERHRTELARLRLIVGHTRLTGSPAGRQTS
ncbi:hypothetical protein GCM10025786_09480 [Nocardioides caeni]